MFIGQHCDMSFQDVGTEWFHCGTKPMYKGWGLEQSDSTVLQSYRGLQSGSTVLQSYRGLQSGSTVLQSQCTRGLIVCVLSIMQQKNIVDIQCQISKMNGQIEERHTVIECLTREELQLQVRHQKLITEVQDVLNQKQAMLLKFQGDKAFSGELDSRGTDPKSEFVTLNEKEHKLVSYTPHI